MNEPPRTNILKPLAVAFVLCVMMFDWSWADNVHKCQGNACNGGDTTIGDTVLTGGDVTIGDTTLTGGDVSLTGGNMTSSNSVNVKGSYALSGADMEIGDCLATYSMLFGLMQNTKINPFCEALRMDAQGKYQAAAKMRCSTWSYKRIYGKGQTCIDAVIVSAPIIQPAIFEAPDDDRYDALYADFQVLRAQTIQRVAEAEKTAQRANAAVVRATPVNQYGISQEQRDDLAKVFPQ